MSCASAQNLSIRRLTTDLIKKNLETRNVVPNNMLEWLRSLTGNMFRVLPAPSTLYAVGYTVATLTALPQHLTVRHCTVAFESRSRIALSIVTVHRYKL